MKAGKARAVANDQRADALGTAELVGGERQVVDAERGEIDGHAAGRLHRIGVHGEPCAAPTRGHFGDRLQHAGLVVGHLQREQRRARPRELRSCTAVGNLLDLAHDAIAVDGERHDCAPGLPRRRQHRVVLDAGQQDRVPAAQPARRCWLPCRRW